MSRKRGAGKYRPTGAWRSGINAAPRWGEKFNDPEVMKSYNAWADRVGDKEPTELRHCGECGGWATRTCTHLTT